MAHYFRGNAYVAKQQYDLAISDFTRAVEINPNYAAAFIARGVSYARLTGPGKPSEEAIADYTQAIRVDPTYALAYSNRAGQYNMKEKYDLAVADATKAIELDPQYPAPYFIKARAFEKKFQYEDAIATLRALIASTTDKAAIERAKSIIRSLGGTL